MCYLVHYLICERPYRWRITTSSDKEVIAALIEDKKRLEELWGDALKKCHTLERRLAQKDALLKEQHAELRRRRAQG